LDSFGVLEPVSALFGVVVAPVMGAGGFGGWFWTRLVRRGGFPSKMSGRGLVYGGARVGV